MKLNECKTVEQFSDYIMGLDYQDEFGTYKEWCDALEPVITRLHNDYLFNVLPVLAYTGKLTDSKFKLYRYQMEQSIAKDGVGMHWCNEPEDIDGDPNLVMDFDLALPHIAFWNWLDGIVEFVVPQSTLKQCNIKQI